MRLQRLDSVRSERILKDMKIANSPVLPPSNREAQASQRSHQSGSQQSDKDDQSEVMDSEEERRVQEKKNSIKAQVMTS